MKREEQLVKYKEVSDLAIYANRTLKIMESVTQMDKDVVLYRGNRNVYIFLSIDNLSFGFRNLLTDYETRMPSHAYIMLLSPLYEEIPLGKTEIVDDKIRFCITEKMIDELTEVGDYTIVIDLYDSVEDSLLTIPPIEGQLKVRDRITSLIDD